MSKGILDGFKQIQAFNSSLNKTLASKEKSVKNDKDLNKKLQKDKTLIGKQIYCTDRDFFVVYLPSWDKFYLISYKKKIAVIIQGENFEPNMKELLIKEILKTKKRKRSTSLFNQILFYINRNNMQQDMSTYSLRSNEKLDPNIKDLIAFHNLNGEK